MLSVYLSMIDTQQDRDKFERLFHQYERCLKYTAQNILGDEEMAEFNADPEDWETRPDTLLLHREEEAKILEAIRCLPADYRYILSLKYAYDCSSAQMAALLNCSEKLARVKLSRARKSLMNRLEHPQKKSGR